METPSSTQLLRDAESEPTDALLRLVLKKDVFRLLKAIENHCAESGFDLDWHYYRDGKAWLGKITLKKKTIAWLSAWDDFIKVSFYFTEKTREGVSALAIHDTLKAPLSSAKPIGKLIPLTLDIRDERALKDFKTVSGYKAARK